METEFDNSATEAAQAARYRMMEGKKLLWVSCHYAPMMYQSLKPMIKGVVDLGVCVHVCVGTTDPDRVLANQMVDDGLAASVLFADMSDDDATCEHVYAAAVGSGVVFDGVFSPHEVVQTIIGELAERLGLPGNTKDAYVKARDKKACRVACVEKGVPTPRFAPITPETIEEAVEAVGLPLVIKPSSGTGSEGIYKCNTVNDVRTRISQLIGDIRTSQTISWSPGLEISLLCEEYIDGPEFDVDLLLQNGNVVYANIIDNWPTLEPTFLETASNCPSAYDTHVQEELKAYAAQCTKALGFTQGCFHVECKYSTSTPDKHGQPMLIEVNPRMGGGRTNIFHKAVYNIDLFDNFLMTALGIPINPPVNSTPAVCMGDLDVCAPRTGVLLHNRWLDDIALHPLVVSATPSRQPGDHVKGADTGVPVWVATIIVKGMQLSDVCAALTAFVDTIDVPIVGDTDKTATDTADTEKKSASATDASIAIQVA